MAGSIGGATTTLPGSQLKTKPNTITKAPAHPTMSKTDFFQKRQETRVQNGVDKPQAFDSSFKDAKEAATRVGSEKIGRIGPAHKDKSDEQLLRDVTNRLKESETGRSVYNDFKKTGAKIEILDGSDEKFEGGAAAIYRRKDNTIYISREQFKTSENFAVMLLGHEMTHAIDQKNTGNADKVVDGFTDLLLTVSGKSREYRDGRARDLIRDTEVNAYSNGEKIRQELGIKEQPYPFVVNDDGSLKSREDLARAVHDLDLYKTGADIDARTRYDRVKGGIDNTIGVVARGTTAGINGAREGVNQLGRIGKGAIDTASRGVVAVGGGIESAVKWVGGLF